MYHIKNDKRALRSAELIYTALAELMVENKFEEIKISELVSQAQIGRATFYRNFDFLEDVLQWRCEQILGEMGHYLVTYQKEQADEDRFPLLKPLLRFFYMKSDIVELLIKAKRIDILQTAFYERLQRFRQMSAAMTDIAAEYIDYGQVMRASVAVSILAHWVKTGKQQAPDELADAIGELATQRHGLNVFL